MKKIMIVIAVLLTSGCATQSFLINGDTSAEPTKAKMQNFFVEGVGQTQEMDASAICGGADKVIKVESKIEFIDGFLEGITLGLYAPHHARVFCKK